MKVLLACSAPYGEGGLGRTLVDVLSAFRAPGREIKVWSGEGGTGPVPPADVTLQPVAPTLPKLLSRVPPFRYHVGLQQDVVFTSFAKAVAARIHERYDLVVAFAGQAQATFARARALGTAHFELISATPHLSHVWRQHQLAIERFPIEADWLIRRHLERGLDEYQSAERIWVMSEYAKETFVQEGIPESKLRMLPVAADPRFTPGGPETADAVFRVVYTGLVCVTKGVPLLLEAFSRLTCPDASLTLVGSTGSRGMRGYMEQWCRRDHRIRLAPGDPLPHLRRATVYVHPSYQDGFGYAVAEAVSCGVPVIVSDHTGARSLVRQGINGEIVPVNDDEAILRALQRYLERHQLSAGRASSMPSARS